ncbi:hypothetical protein SAMN06265338_1485 [Rhodoblastus acidophilus]|uniref:Uncharacterized protein n=1 Tax=Rhodoblastus acidophilus TaxID=1074 RepID=A0A212SHW4_RHOAC|nr:hypothetical protein SAMN06265338_1485 [Rhodoblastus acidophilus]
MQIAASNTLLEKRADALLVPCASRKSVQVTAGACAISLPNAPQREVETAWLSLLSALPPESPARSLYSGRGFHLARQAASATGAALYAVSAGLGLVAAEKIVPAYGITVGGRSRDSVASRVLGPFDVGAWWRAISGGPFATPLHELFTAGSVRPVLMALTQPYARMLAPVLDSLVDSDVVRLRIVGVNLKSILPQRLFAQILPYDERLDAIFPGTRADFPQRAIAHFASEGLSGGSIVDASEHQVWVENALAGHVRPERPERPRLSDDELMVLIERHLSPGSSVGRLLRVLRDEERVACEQARFSRLYRRAIERRAA